MLVTLDENEQRLVANSIIGQKLSVRDTETLIKKIKDKQNGSKKSPKKNIHNLDNQLLHTLKDKLESLGIQSQIIESKITLSFKNDVEIATLIKKVSK